MTKTYKYRAYALNLESEFELRGLLAAEFEKPDIVICRTKIDRKSPTNPEGREFIFREGYLSLDWSAVGKFDIVGTDKIYCDINEGIDDAMVCYPLLGSVMALLLQVRKLLVFHASGILFNGKCIGFMGDKGAGKSTTAATLISKGYPLVSDDVIAFNFEADKIEIMPGFPQMKLTDEASSIVNLEKSVVQPKIDFPGLDKRQHNIDSYFFDEKTVPGRLYVLFRGDEAKIIKPSETNAFQFLWRYSYFYRFGKEGMATGLAQWVMEHCIKLAKADLVRALIVPNSVERIDEIISLIEDDLSE